MGGKILDENDEVIFEFEDSEPVAVLLGGFFCRAKFGERFESQILFSPWGNRLLKAMLKAQENQTDAFGKKLSDYKFPSFNAPDRHLEAGMTNMDWGLRELFNDYTQFLCSYPALLRRWDWKSLPRDARAERIRVGLFPHPISDPRQNQMIEEVDSAIKTIPDLYNPDYSHHD